MATEAESWECVEKSTPRSESEDSCVVVSYADSSCSSGRPESKGSVRSLQPCRLYISMVERVKQRRQRRQELEMRYEIARKQKEVEKQEKEERISTLNKLQKKAILEQKMAALSRQKQMEKEAQQRHELLRLQQELARLHNIRRLLLHYGLTPWHRFLLQCRTRMKAAFLSYDRQLMKKSLKRLYIRYREGKSFPKRRARSLACLAKEFQDKWRLRYFWLYWIEGLRGHHLYNLCLLKRCCKAMKEVLEYHRKLEQIGDNRNEFRLLSWTWSKWTDLVRSEKSSQLLKCLEINQIASLHWQRVTYLRILKAWKDGIIILKYEKQRMQHNAEAWNKIRLWLDEHQQARTQIRNKSAVEVHRSKVNLRVARTAVLES